MAFPGGGVSLRSGGSAVLVLACGGAGVEAGFRESWAPGTVVDVMCPALVPVLR